MKKLIFPTEEQLQTAQDFYARGQSLQGYEYSQSVGPLEQWGGTSARLLAGRYAVNLGAGRLSDWLHLTAWRADRENPEARYYLVRALLSRRGPLEAWEKWKQFGDSDGNINTSRLNLRAEWLALGALILGLFRDFDRAETLLQRASRVDENNPWICIERSSVLERQDRYEEALEWAQRGLKLRPWYRPGVQSAAHLLQLLGRDDEALSLLREACTHVENGFVALQLAGLLREVSEYSQAGEAIAMAEKWMPLAEPDLQAHFCGARSDVAYHAGDFAQAAHLAREAQRLYESAWRRPGLEPEDEEARGFWGRIAANLEAATPHAKRVELPIPFVRQHEKTCAPATLSAISRFWNRPAEHLEIAENICYDGTPDYSERRWATENGYLAREFKVTWDIARQLLDRELPFTLTTTQTANAHLQAIIGYDERRGTLLIRDPYFRSKGEALAHELLQQQEPYGPRGMLLVPPEKTHQLDGLDLPEAEEYDLLHELNRALVEHRRADASTHLDSLEQLAPDGRLTWQGCFALAAYDGDVAKSIECADALLRKYPDDANLQMMRLWRTRDFEPRENRLQTLRELCARPHADPIFWRELAQELLHDARCHDEARRAIGRALRARPHDAVNIYIQANLQWNTERLKALETYRFASSLADKDEQMAEVYGSAARFFGRSDEVLRFLRGRFARFGHQSSLPVRTLHGALCRVDRAHEALQVLDEALEKRPDDGDLLLFAAQEFARYSRFERADELLNRAQGRSASVSWESVRAQIATWRGDSAQALEGWNRVLESEPLSLDAHRALTYLLAQTQNPRAAIAHLEEATQRFPHHYPLRRLFVEWLREEDKVRGLEELQTLVKFNPADAWMRREFATALCEERRYDEALEQADAALHLRPTDSYSHSTRAYVLLSAERDDEAIEPLRQAIRCSADNGYAIVKLVEAHRFPAPQREALAWIEGELARQTLMGDGMLAFRQAADGVLPPEELWESLERARVARPDLWQTWSAVVDQLLALDRREEALKRAREATSRFPLVNTVWIDLANVERVLGDVAGERAAIEKALEIDPSWSYGIRALSDHLERHGQREQARELLERAVLRDPRDAMLRAAFADTLWNCKQGERALEEMQTALRMEPGLMWGWDAVKFWSDEMGQPEFAENLAREIARQRAGEVRSWQILARVLDGRNHREERFAAIEKALELRPRSLESLDYKARMLAREGRFDEAIETLRTAADAAGEAVASGETVAIGETVASGETVATSETAMAEDAEEPGAQATSLATSLRARIAWVEAERGDMDAAIAQMKAVLRDDPQYYGGWKTLAQWHDARSEYSEYVNATREMTRIAPQDAVTHGFLAHALLQNGEREAAKTELERAWSLDPNYAYAGQELFELHFDDNELEKAQGIAQRLLDTTADNRARCCLLQVAARADKRDEALRIFRDMVEHAEREENQRIARRGPDPDHAADAMRVLTWSRDQLRNTGWSNEIKNMLEEALRNGERPENAHSFAASLWAEELLQGDDALALSSIWQWCSHDEHTGAFAFAAWIRHQIEAEKWKTLRPVLQKHSAWLRAHLVTWAAVVEAHYAMKNYDEAVRWAADWQERSTSPEGIVMPAVVPSRTLFDIGLSLRYLKRDAEANNVHRFALQRENDYLEAYHTLWVALDETVSTDAAQHAMARRRLACIDAEQMNSFYQFMTKLLELALRVQMAADAGKAFAEAQREWPSIEKLEPKFRQGPLERRMVTLCFDAMTQGRGLSAKLWRWSKSLL